MGSDDLICRLENPLAEHRGHDHRGRHQAAEGDEDKDQRVQPLAHNRRADGARPQIFAMSPDFILARTVLLANSPTR